MPIPILIVYSQLNDARYFGEDILGGFEKIMEYLDIKLRIEVIKRKKDIFEVVAFCKPLDYDFEENNERIRWGLGSAAPWVEIEFKDWGLLVKVPDTPYYSCHINIWNNGKFIVASPWWVLPSIAASLTEGFIINNLYVWSVISWSYPLGYRKLHLSVYRCPIGSVYKVECSKITTIGKMRYSDVKWSNPETLSSLLIRGAREFLEILEKKGIREVWVGLSGGLDSRTVLGALIRASENLDVKVGAFTNLYPWVDLREIEITREIAELFGINHKIIDRKKPNPSEEFRAISNPFRVSDRVIANGTGGDKTLDPLGHIRWKPPKDNNKMALKIIKNIDYSVDVPIIHKHVVKMRGEMINNLTSGVDTPLELYRKYLLDYRLMNWLTSFNQPIISPFLYPSFFREAFYIDPKFKDYFILYTKVIDKLDKRLLKIQYYNLSLRLSTINQIQKIKCIISFIKSGFIKVLRGQRGSIIPTEASWEATEKLYEELNKRMEPLELKLYKELSSAIEHILEIRPRSAKALRVAQGIIRVLKEISMIFISMRK